MPAKRKSKTNTKQKPRRTSRNTKAARLIDFLRKFGMTVFVVVFTAWIGAWLWFGGVFHKVADSAVETYYSVTTAQGYVVDDILVEGRVHTDPDVLLALVDIERGAPILSFRPDPVKEAIEEISWIRSAQVERRLPDKIYIRLEERKPLALWQNDKVVRLIDTYGEVISAAEISDFADLIIVTGEDAPQEALYLIEMLEAEPVLKEHVEAASRVSGRRWDLKMKNGMTVNLPEEDIGLALSRLRDAHEESGILKKNLRTIDLRSSDRMVVRTAPGAVKQYEAGFFVNGEI